MNLMRKRYTQEMLAALSTQPLFALIINAALRGVAFSLFVQLIAVASGQRASTLLNIAILAGVFAFVIFSVDLIEKNIARESLRRRG